MGETQNQPFQLSFNASLKVDFQGSRVTSDGGLLLVRELDERLGFGELIEQHLTDSRRGKNTQFPFTDLLRQSVYSRLAGYEDLNDAQRLSQDPTFRLISSEKVWDRGAALTSRLQTFETEMLAEEENFAGLGRLNRALIGKAEAMDSGQRTVLHLDSTEIPVYGEQEQSDYNGYFESTCFHPLLLFNREGDCLAAKLRPGNVHSADDWDELLRSSDSRRAGKKLLRGPMRPLLNPKRGTRTPWCKLRHLHSGEREPGTSPSYCRVRRGAQYQALGRVQELSLPGSELDQGTARGGEGGIPLRRAVPAGWLHRNQLPDFKPGGGTLLQQRGTAEQWIKEGKQAVAKPLRLEVLRTNEIGDQNGNSSIKVHVPGIPS